MDKFKFKIFYDNLCYRPHVAIKINGKDLAKMVMRERSKMISQGMINPFHSDGGVYSWTVCRLAGRYIGALIYDILTSTKPYVLTHTCWIEEGMGTVAVNIRETYNSVIWENNYYSLKFEFDKDLYYQKIANLINTWGGIVTNDTLDKVSFEIIKRLEDPLSFCYCYYDGIHYIPSYRRMVEISTLSKINNEWIDDQWLEDKFQPRKKSDRKRKYDCKKKKFFV